MKHLYYSIKLKILLLLLPQLVEPASPIGRSDFNDNTAEADDDIEVLEGPEVEIGSYEASDDEKLDDMDDSSDVNDSAQIPDPLQFSLFNEGSDIFEVEKIIAGPLRRREHLGKVCYKVRWKGYGPEADTWQPKADLVYVQDMIEEYRKEKSQQSKLKKRKTSPATNSKENGLEVEAKRMNMASKLPSQDSDDSDSERSWHPDYGYMKDTFWKDLELGRHTNNTEFFEGDMYSKVKGSRRAAHAEAVANIQKQQQQQQQQAQAKTSTPTSRPKISASKSSGKTHVQRGMSKSPRYSSSSSSKSPSLSPKAGKATAPKSRKRSSNPFSARGYMSSKRSRRSKEVKGSPGSTSEGKRSSVTSETVGIVTMSDAGRDVLKMNTSSEDSSDLAQVEDDVNEVFRKPEGVKTTVSSETMLATSSETTSAVAIGNLELEEDVIKPEALFSLETDNVFQPPVSNSEDRTEIACRSRDTSQASRSLTVGASSGQSFNSSIPDSTSDNNSDIQKSTLNARAETSASVESTHKDVCLWGGACNRSDCRANRRWNNKNGSGDEDKDKNNENTSSPIAHPSSSQPSTTSSGESASSSHSSSSLETESPQKPRHRESGSSITSSPQFSPSPVKRSSSSCTSADSPSYRVVGEQQQSLLSSRSYSSDSSFDESVGPALSRDVVSNSFGRMDALAERMHMDTLASSSLTRGSSLSNVNSSVATSERSSASHGSAGTRRAADTGERPGLFSNSFSFLTRGHSTGLDTELLTSSDILSHHSSPGKENTANIDRNQSSSSMCVHSARVERPMEISNMDTVSSSSSVFSQPPPGIGISRARAQDSQDSWSSRKRTGDGSQPLEKIPSPNSRRGADLDRRISTLTCDELEDFPEQGDDCYGSNKVTGFVTNADLLQAVNLGKAEVVKRAIQHLASGHRLDFEQPDNNGVTLLMKAVQKGNLAVVEMLLENGANVNAQQVSGMTALMMAAEQNGVCLVTLLLKHGANSSLYTVGSDCAETALMKAIKRQHREVVNLMLRVGVNISAPSCNSISALQLAIERRNPQIEGLVRAHTDRLTAAFESRVLSTLEDTAQLMEQLFPLQCFPLREAQEFVVKFNSNIQPVPSGEGFLLFIAHTKINDKGVRCRFHGSCPIASVSLNGVVQSPLTKEVNFVTSCHPIVSGCNTLVITKLPEYTSKAKLLVCAYRAKLIC
ncbi:M-phase phosphoprotein 8 [Aplysia californica]|uniref:M-phase phosphoprotein 8 n=1 Tax=Aplysia californica TaxID=6500 RepID=A0ABM0JP43_APLCA|nr:M-phase phosphoprotein 8 [Aplysia californica]